MCIRDRNTTGVFDMQPVSAARVAKQIDCVFEDIRPDAVKLGMLYDTCLLSTSNRRPARCSGRSMFPTV